MALNQIVSVEDALKGQELSPWYLPPAQTPESSLIPYSPDGWAQSKLMPGEKPALAEKGKKGKPEGVGFTPEQMATLSKMAVGDMQAMRHSPTGAAPAPRSQMGQMGQVQVASAKPAEQRASLGQIIYAGKRF